METSELKKKRKLPWWFKWFGIPLLIVAILVAAWCSWYFYAWSQFNKQIDALKAAGQPTTWAETIPPHVPDEDNALLAYQQAVEMYKTDLQPLLDSVDSKIIADGWSYQFYPLVAFAEYPVLRKAYTDEVQQLLLKGDRTYRKCIEALGKQRLSWSLTPNFFDTSDLTIFTHLRYLSRFLTLRVVLSHEQKDDLQAIQGLHALFDIHDTLCQVCPSMIVHLFSISNGAAASRTVEIVSQTLLSQTSATDEAKSEIRALITRILNETHLTSGHVSSWQAVRLDPIKLARSGKLHLDEEVSPWKKQRGPFAPFYLSYATRGIGDMQNVINAAAATEFSTFKKTLGAWSPEPVGLERIVDHFTDVSSVFLYRDECISFGKLYFSGVALRRMAAIALAIRLYELDHGKRPETLTQLVPDYLPHVPVDPFESSGKPIQYLPNAKYPLLYSVGADETDDGGKYADNPNSLPVKNKFDLPFFLTPDRPRKKLIRESSRDDRFSSPPSGPLLRPFFTGD